MLNLVKQLKSDGVPIDGIGFQCHFIVGEIPSSFQSNLEAFTALGVEVGFEYPFYAFLSVHTMYQITLRHIRRLLLLSWTSE